MKYIDITGKRYGRLIVLKKVKMGKGKRYMVLCKCDCGKEKLIRPNDIKMGKTTSCGCYIKEVLEKSRRKHGRCYTKEYRIWASMLDRCRNKNLKSWKNYGGRGITVCKEWYSFKNFYEDMGNKPKGKSLDRIDNNGNYCKENCKWSTNKEQTNNMRKNIPVFINGQKSNLKELADSFGIKYTTLWQRLYLRNYSLRKSLLS